MTKVESSKVAKEVKDGKRRETVSPYGDDVLCELNVEVSMMPLIRSGNKHFVPESEKNHIEIKVIVSPFGDETANVLIK